MEGIISIIFCIFLIGSALSKKSRRKGSPGDWKKWARKGGWGL